MNKPTRVVFVTNYRSLLPTSPYKNVFTERSAEALRAAGIDVEFFDIGLSHSPLRQFASWRALRRLIREREPDLLNAQQGTITGLVTVLTFHKSIITYTGTDVLPGASVPLWRTIFGIFLSNLETWFTPVYIVMTEEMRRAMWWNRRKAVVIPHGVNLDVFKPAPRSEARRRLGWDERPRVLFMGWRDEANKGKPLADETMARVREVMPEAELVMPAGVAPDDVAVYMQAADVLLFTSRREGSPNVVKEALACNLPIVGVAVGDVEERLAGVTLSHVLPRDPQTLADAVVNILRTGGARSDGREHVQELSWPQITERTIAVYERALGRPVVRRIMHTA